MLQTSSSTWSSDSIASLEWSYLTEILNSHPSSGKCSSNSLILNLPYLRPSNHRQTDRLNMLTKPSNNTYRPSSTTNKTTGPASYLSLSSPSTMQRMPQLVSLPSTLLMAATLLLQPAWSTHVPVLYLWQVTTSTTFRRYSQPRRTTSELLKTTRPTMRINTAEKNYLL